MRSRLMQDQQGQIQESHSISAGLDFPSVGPQHAYLASIGRARYVAVTDQQAIAAFQRLARAEGIIPALESAHALAWAIDFAAEHAGQALNIVVNLSGRGDKDIFTVDQVLRQSAESK